MKGLKNVRTRHSDALTQAGWDQLESLLALYYRGHGYAVKHCGTRATGAQFDGGIDLGKRARVNLRLKRLSTLAPFAPFAGPICERNACSDSACPDR